MRAKFLSRNVVCNYFKESLPTKVLNITNLHECLVCELFLNGRRSYILCLYRSPSQSSDEYNHFIKNFEQLIVHLASFKSHLLLITDDFNVRSSSWWSGHVDIIEGARLESIASFCGLHQIINEPTQILPSSSSFTDLIFTNQLNMTINSGVHPSLHQNCHHQLMFAKVNMKISYPLPYKSLVWDYCNANVEAIDSAIETLNWEKAFDGKDIHAKVALFNETLLNNSKKVPIILPLFVNNKFVTGFQEKANVFNSFFAKQCSPIPSSSVLPAKI